MTWPNYSPATRKAVNDLLKRGGSLSAYRANKDFGSGPVEGSYAWKLEREIERRFQVRHCVAVNSGTAALHAALVSLDLRGGEVITSPYSFSATVSAILLAGGTPRFADVDPYTFCITKETVKRVITKRTRAILPVHLFGGLADMRGLKSLGLPVVEDACQAVGASREGVFSGSFAQGGAYSFNGGKNVPAGECGAYVTNDSEYASKARLLMNHAENFGKDYVGLNYRPNEVTACIAYHGLLELEERNQRRIDLVDTLQKSLGWKLHEVDGSHVFYVVPFDLDADLDKTWYGPQDRDKFIRRMKRKGVTVGAGYINPTLEKYKAFRKYCAKPLPVVTELSEKTLCLLSTLTPDRPLSYAKHVADCIREALS